MKVRIVVEDPKKGRLEVPLLRSEVQALGDLGFIFEDAFWKALELNKIDKPIATAIRKFQFLLFDVLDGGKTYRMEKKPDGTSRFKFAGHHYLVRKPRWQLSRNTPAPGA